MQDRRSAAGEALGAMAGIAAVMPELMRMPSPLCAVEADLHATTAGRHRWQEAGRRLHAVAAFRAAGGRRQQGDPPRRAEAARQSALVAGALFALTFALGLTLNTSAELLQVLDPGCGVFVSVTQYLFVVARSALAGAAGGVGAGGAGGGRGARLRAYALITAANTGSTILWNAATSLGGPPFYPVFLTMCSGQIVLIMLAKRLMRGARFSAGECCGAVLMSGGMALVVIAKGAQGGGGDGGGGGGAGEGAQPAPQRAMLGAAGVLLLGLLVLGVQKVLQELAFERFGQDPRVVAEMVFYQHLLGLPLLLGEHEALRAIVARWAAMEWRRALGGALPLPPAAWLLLGFNTVANAAATTCLLTLVSSTNALVASLCVTLYRFGAILVSALVINAPPWPPPLMAAGCALVPLGSLLYLASAQRRTGRAASTPTKHGKGE